MRLCSDGHAEICFDDEKRDPYGHMLETCPLCKTQKEIMRLEELLQDAKRDAATALNLGK